MSRSFRHQTFARRFDVMGDEAEGVFEETYQEGWVRFGLNRPPINLANVPRFIRHAPDYLTSKGLVEVQGFGRDQTFKLKHEKLFALQDWHAKFRVDLFVWDSHNKRYGWLRLNDLCAELDDIAEFAQFPEGKPYLAIMADRLPVIEWTQR